MRLVLLAMTVVLALARGQAAAPGAGTTARFDAGKELYRNGDIAGALRQLNASETAGESAPERPYYQGVCLAKQGEWTQAEARLAPYAAAHPAEARAWYWLAQAQLYERRFAEAKASIQRTIAIQPNSAEAYRTLGEIALQLHEHEGAYQAWLTAHKLDTKDARTTYYLGRLFIEADFPSEAADWFRETLRLEPDNPAAMTYLGVCAERLNMQKEALDLHRAAVRESKRTGKPHSWAFLNLAKLERQLGQTREALALLEEGEKLCPEAHLLTLLGQMLTAEQPSRAEQVLRRAIAMDPTIPDAHYRLALLLRTSGRDDESRAEMQKFQATKQVEDRNKVTIQAVRKRR